MKKLMYTKDTEFEQNGTNAVIIDTNNRAGKPINIDIKVLGQALYNMDEDISEEFVNCIHEAEVNVFGEDIVVPPEEL